MKLRIMLMGKTGQIGRELANLLPRLGHVTAFGRNEVEFADAMAIRTAVRRVAPQIIVNAAAYTDVDAAESQEPLATCINATATRVIADEAARSTALVIHYSTDYVFDGRQTSPYQETDLPNPVNAYGRSKLAGEKELWSSGVPCLVFRTSWVYGLHGKNFLLSVVRLASEREQLQIVSDQIGSPSWSRFIAAATYRVLTELVTREYNFRTAAGISQIYHLSASGETRWFGFANAILEEIAGIDKTSAWLVKATGSKPLDVRGIIPVSSRQFASPTRRPAYSVLSNEKFVRRFGFCVPGWREQLRMAVRDLPVDDVLLSLEKPFPC